MFASVPHTVPPCERMALVPSPHKAQSEDPNQATVTVTNMRERERTSLQRRFPRTYAILG